MGDVMKKFKSVGKKSYYLHICRKKDNNELELIAEISSQYGWQDGCQDRAIKFLKFSTMKIVDYMYGDPYTLGYAHIEGEEVNKNSYEFLANLGWWLYGDTIFELIYNPDFYEKLGWIKSCNPKGIKQKKFIPEMGKTGQEVYCPINNKYYRSIFNKDGIKGSLTYGVAHVLQFMEPRKFQGVTFKSYKYISKPGWGTKEYIKEETKGLIYTPK